MSQIFAETKSESGNSGTAQFASCVAAQGQRPGNKPAQGNALGNWCKKDKALKGRHNLSRPFRAFPFFETSHPGRCPGLACWRTFGARSSNTSTCSEG